MPPPHALAEHHDQHDDEDAADAAAGLVPPGIGMRIAAATPPPPPPEPPTSRTREVSSRALGLKRMRALLMCQSEPAHPAAPVRPGP